MRETTSITHVIPLDICVRLCEICGLDIPTDLPNCEIQNYSEPFMKGKEKGNINSSELMLFKTYVELSHPLFNRFDKELKMHSKIWKAAKNLENELWVYSSSSKYNYSKATLNKSH